MFGKKLLYKRASFLEFKWMHTGKLTTISASIPVYLTHMTSPFKLITHMSWRVQKETLRVAIEVLAQGAALQGKILLL